jgi:hypothetical protein
MKIISMFVVKINQSSRRFYTLCFKIEHVSQSTMQTDQRLKHFYENTVYLSCNERGIPPPRLIQLHASLVSNSSINFVQNINTELGLQHAAEEESIIHHEHADRSQIFGANSSNYMPTGFTSTGRSAADVTDDKARGGGGYMLTGSTSIGRSEDDVTKRKSDAGKKGVESGKDKTHASHKKAHGMEFKRWYDCKTCGKKFSSGAKNPKHQITSKPPCTQSGSTGASVCCNLRVCKCDGEGNLH